MSMHTRSGTGLAPAAAACPIRSRCSGQSTISVTAAAAWRSAASSASADRSTVG